MWATIIIMIVQYLVARKKGVSRNTALLGSLAAGAGTYYVATQTDWGKATLGRLDDAMTGFLTPDQAVSSSGNPVTGPDGNPVYAGSTTGGWGTSVLSGVGSWVASNTPQILAGTAIGATAVSWYRKYPWLVIGGVALVAWRLIK